ncbi:MAG: YhbY family RNA-binding protein [Clostridia bacterium]|nr:YhbY family RNA-binding protein [Oscillospiraceae bacterium]MBR4892524.1 YhbY family RNA-binding protein [Clostridia bacterium]
MINSRQRAYLRSLANSVPARYQVGKGEITENQVNMFLEAMEANEIIKITVLENSLRTARDVCDELVELTGAEPVQVIGRKIVLYKESKKNKTIKLPK